MGASNQDPRVTEMTDPSAEGFRGHHVSDYISLPPHAEPGNLAHERTRADFKLNLRTDPRGFEYHETPRAGPSDHHQRQPQAHPRAGRWHRDRGHPKCAHAEGSELSCGSIPSAGGCQDGSAPAYRTCD